MCFRKKKVQENPPQQPTEQKAPAYKPVKVFYGRVQDGMIPAARASQHVQLTPIVTPITMVPYMSTEAGLFVYADDDDEDDEREENSDQQ